MTPADLAAFIRRDHRAAVALADVLAENLVEAVARAERAEAERDAERALRKAFHSMIANARGDIAAIKAPDARAVREAEDALRSLGVEP